MNKVDLFTERSTGYLRIYKFKGFLIIFSQNLTRFVGNLNCMDYFD